MLKKLITGHFQIGKLSVPKEAVAVALVTGIAGGFFGPIGAAIGALAGYVGDIKIRKP